MVSRVPRPPWGRGCAGALLDNQRRKKHNSLVVRDYGRDYLLVPPSPGVIAGMRLARETRVRARPPRHRAITYRECAGCDPKDGELCLIRLKSGETLMEDRSNSDVQIDCQNWA